MFRRDEMGVREDKYVLDDRGEPVPEPDLYRWAMWIETADRTVARTTIAFGEGSGEVFVSTVFLGLDHAFGEGAPILWETMIFGGPLDGNCWRSRSRDEARRRHDEACKACSALFGVCS